MCQSFVGPINFFSFLLPLHQASSSTLRCFQTRLSLQLQLLLCQTLVPLQFGAIHAAASSSLNLYFPLKTFAFPSFFDEESDFSFALDLLDPPRLSCFRIFYSVTDLIEIEKSPLLYTYRRIQHRVEPEFSIQRLCDRVSDLESRLEDLVSVKVGEGERKYTVTTEIKGPLKRKYKWTTEINNRKKKEEENRKRRGGSTNG